MSAVVEATTLQKSGLITDTVIAETDRTFRGLVAGADKVLNEPELAKMYRLLSVAIGAGMTALIEEGVSLLGDDRE